MSDTKKYFILSDLHLEFRQGKEKEFWAKFPESQGARTCICAGDLTVARTPRALEHFVTLCSRFDQVIYVPGNHEYYGSNPIETDNRLADIEYLLQPRLKILRSGEVYIHEGQRFLGDTMWFVDKPEVHVYRQAINDSYQIANLFPWVFERSSAFIQFIQAELTEDDIVVTHHIPTDFDTPLHWKKSTTQPYFVNDSSRRYFMDPNTVKPKAWIYGHTHDKHDYLYGRTRFVCNPLGYPHERDDLPVSAEPVIYEL